MVLNSCVVLGFSLLLSAELLAFNRKSLLAAVGSIAGYCAVSLSMALLAMSPHPSWPFSASMALPGGIAFNPPNAARALLIALAMLSSILLVWSVFLEIPYLRKKHKIESGTTVSKGSYAICRHPGFWWFALLAVSLATLRGSAEYFFTISLMIGMNLLLIALQDIYTFPRMFSGYKEYRNTVPFLVPRLFCSKRKHS